MKTVRAWAALALFIILALPGSLAAAQDDPDLSLVGEHSLGDACPRMGAMHPDGRTVWMVVFNCISDFTISLLAVSAEDAAVVGASDGPFEMDVPGSEVFGADRPLVIGGDGALTADFVDWMSGATASFEIDPVTGVISSVEGSPRILTAEAIMAALPGFTGYTDFLTYSADRTRALTQDDSAFYVFDAASGQNIMRLEPAGGIESAFAEFGPNSDRLYLHQMAEPGNYDNPAESVFVYSIPDGELVTQFDSPYAIYSISPDERYGVVSTIPCCDHMSLAVLDLETGALSESLPTQTSTVALNICKNDGRTTELGWTSGDPLLVDIVWLPDSSGFVTLHSEQFSSGPNPCYTNDSRMRVYAVAG
ncbi:MAG: hypothetical protein JNL34_18020 [Anaerolineae bacterium]|nr:hypothetical protein [Anaerolineae bacterium]